MARFLLQKNNYTYSCYNTDKFIVNENRKKKETLKSLRFFAYAQNDIRNTNYLSLSF